jgi:hypothetical protein
LNTYVVLCRNSTRGKQHFFVQKAFSLEKAFFLSCELTMNIIMSELYLSVILGKTVIDEMGREIGKLQDLIMVPGEIFPQVSRLLVGQRKELMSTLS